MPFPRHDGPVSQKLSNLRAAIAARVAQDDVFCPGELAQVAAYLEAILPLVATMEERPIPPAFRLIQGGAA